jgi:hypothetical protein
MDPSVTGGGREERIGPRTAIGDGETIPVIKGSKDDNIPMPLILLSFCFVCFCFFFSFNDVDDDEMDLFCRWLKVAIQLAP